MPTPLLRAAALAVAWLPQLLQAAPLSLESALDLAVQRSEAARAARAGMASAAESAHAAGQLPDPMLKAGVDNLPVTGRDRLSTTRESMTTKRIGIGQEWVSPEKRAIRQAAAEAMVGREGVAVQTAAAEVRLQTALAYVDAWYAAEALKLTTLTEHHAHEELEAARARLAGAAGSGQEALALAAARGMAADESDEIRQQESAARVALQRWTGAESQELTPPAWAVPPSEEAFAASHPSVVALQRDIEVARRSAAVAASERRPNWTWELSYGQRTGYSDMVSLGVSIPLQVARGERQDREAASKRALVEKAEAELAEATRTALGQYRTLASDIERLRQRIERYSASVVKPAEQRTSAALAGYRSNQAPLVALFEARHAEVETWRKLLSLQRELARAQAQLAFTPIDEGGAP